MNDLTTSTTAKKRTVAITLLLVAIIFDRLFWHQGIGINLALFASLVLAITVYDHGWNALSVPARWSGLGLLISSTMFVVYGSIIAGFATFASLFVLVAFAHAPELRAVSTAIAQWCANIIATPIGLVTSLGGALPGTPAMRKSWRWTRLVLLPLVIVVIYFQLYRGGNSKFNAMTAGFLDQLSDAFSRFFANVFTPHTLFFLFGLFLSAALVIRSVGPLLINYESVFRNVLQRIRAKRPHWLAPLNMGALDRERRMGVVLLVMVNLLLLVVNAIDIHWIWFGFTVEPGMSLKEFVHEGTWLLIVSILLSMAILFRLFRGNLNFHPKNRVLLLLAFAWLAQNFILGISVFLRNYHYIAFHGLAYLRIGVIVFLILMLVGLITLFVKIHARKTFFYIIRVNGWAAFAMMIALSTMDWDSAIVRFNLHHWNQGQIDVDNYLAMSDKVLPLLYDDIGRVREQMAKHRENDVRWVEHLDPAGFDDDLDRMRERFLDRYRERRWQSWTWADQCTYDALAVRGLNR